MSPLPTPPGSENLPPTEPPRAVGDTLFYDGFESGTLALWQDGVNAAKHRVLQDGARAAVGTHFLEITYPANDHGGWLTRFFMPGVDSLYVRYFVQVEPAWQGGTKLLLLRGSRTDNQWSAFGVAGRCPTGSDWFATNVVALAPESPGPVRFYSYYPGMAREPDGVTCWGRHSGTGTTTYATGAPVLTRGTWHRVEFWVKLNAPDAADGEQRVWVDGVLQGEWTGLRFRTTDLLRLNSLTLEASLMGPAISTARRLYVDDVLVMTARP